MRHVFIINPRAGKRDQTARIYQMADRLRALHGLDCACMLTDRPGGATEMARRLAESGAALRVYACGGDGTVSEVANGLAGFSNAAMTCVPAGTGNDFLKNFGPDLEKFRDAENLWDGPVFPLDLIDCNGRYCLTIACNGIDAQVAEGVHLYSRSPLLNGRAAILRRWRPTSFCGTSGTTGPSPWTARPRRGTSPWCPCATAVTTAAAPHRCRRPGWTTAC